jgi:Zn-dependent protease with chaperone function
VILSSRMTMPRYRYLSLFLVLASAACSSSYPMPDAGSDNQSATGMPGRSRSDFNRVVSRVEPAAETLCLEAVRDKPRAYCDYRIALDTNPKNPPNAFQTRGEDGRPVIIVSSTLLSEMQSDDEIAFALSHEAAHQIEGHLDSQMQNQILGAMAGAGLAVLLGGDYASQEAIENAANYGAAFGGRAYSQTYEFQADELGAYIAARAGYNPERGAQLFGRPSLRSSGGPVLLSTHPYSPDRMRRVSSTAQEIRRQRAAGVVPSPAYAGR